MTSLFEHKASGSNYRSKASFHIRKLVTDFIQIH